MASFEIIIPPDDAFHRKITASLSQNAIQFSESKQQTLSESDGSSSDILAFLIQFPTVAVFTVALKYLSPILLEIIKTRPIKVTVGETEIHVSRASDLEQAVKAATALSASPQAKPKGRRQT